MLLLLLPKIRELSMREPSVREIDREPSPFPSFSSFSCFLGMAPSMRDLKREELKALNREPNREAVEEVLAELRLCLSL